MIWGILYDQTDLHVTIFRWTICSKNNIRRLVTCEILTCQIKNITSSQEYTLEINIWN